MGHDLKNLHNLKMEGSSRFMVSHCQISYMQPCMIRVEEAMAMLNNIQEQWEDKMQR